MRSPKGGRRVGLYRAMEGHRGRPLTGPRRARDGSKRRHRSDRLAMVPEGPPRGPNRLAEDVPIGPTPIRHPGRRHCRR